MSSTVMYIFGDGRCGHEFVKSVCRYMEKTERCAKCFVVVVDKSFEKKMEDIRHGHGHCAIEAIDMHKLKQSPEELESVMKKHKVDWLIIQPSGDTYSSHEQVKMTLEAYKKCGGHNVIMNSIAKCDECQDRPMKECHLSEEIVKRCCPNSYVILRVQMPLMELDFFAEGVQKERKWMLPTGNSNFSPVSTKRDLACCIGHIVKEQKMVQRFAGQTFTLTNREKINGQRLAQMTGSAFNEDVKFQNISLEDACKILDRYVGGGGGSHGDDDGRRDDSGQGRKSLRRGLLNHCEKDMLLAMFKMIQHNLYDFTTEDVKKISQMEPMSVEEYLRKREAHLRGNRG